MSESRFRVVKSNRANRIALAVAGLVVVGFASVPLWAQPSFQRTLTTYLCLLALAQMWNLLAGYGGLLSVGQQAYIGLGAYGLWVFTDGFGLNPFLAVPLAGLAAVVIALPTSVLAFRLRGGYFAIGTWVIAEAYRLVVTNVDWAGGGSGTTVTGASHVKMATRIPATYLMALGVAVGSLLLVYLLLRSRLGLALTAVRDNETGAESLGVDVSRAKRYVYLISAFGCGLAGAVTYLNLLRIQPNAAFSVQWTALMIFIVVIGGVGSIEGPIIGTIVFLALQELLSARGSWYLILVGGVAMVITIWNPRGIWGLITSHRPLDLFPLRRHLWVVDATASEAVKPKGSVGRSE